MVLELNTTSSPDLVSTTRMAGEVALPLTGYVMQMGKGRRGGRLGRGGEGGESTLTYGMPYGGFMGDINISPEFSPILSMTGPQTTISPTLEVGAPSIGDISFQGGQFSGGGQTGGDQTGGNQTGGVQTGGALGLQPTRTGTTAGRVSGGTGRGTSKLNAAAYLREAAASGKGQNKVSRAEIARGLSAGYGAGEMQHLIKQMGFSSGEKAQKLIGQNLPVPKENIRTTPEPKGKQEPSVNKVVHKGLTIVPEGATPTVKKVGETSQKAVEAKKKAQEVQKKKK